MFIKPVNELSHLEYYTNIKRQNPVSFTPKLYIYIHIYLDFPNLSFRRILWSVFRTRSPYYTPILYCPEFLLYINKVQNIPAV